MPSQRETLGASLESILYISVLQPVYKGMGIRVFFIYDYCSFNNVPCHFLSSFNGTCPQPMLSRMNAVHCWFRGTEALKGHRVVWKIEIYYLIRMTYEWKSMSSGWHNNIVVTHPDEIPISAKSSGWHMVVWYVIRMTYCSVQKSSGWVTARS